MKARSLVVGLGVVVALGGCGNGDLSTVNFPGLFNGKVPPALGDGSSFPTSTGGTMQLTGSSAIATTLYLIGATGGTSQPNFLMMNATTVFSATTFTYATLAAGANALTTICTEPVDSNYRSNTSGGVATDQTYFWIGELAKGFRKYAISGCAEQSPSPSTALPNGTDAITPATLAYTGGNFYFLDSSQLGTFAATGGAVSLQRVFSTQGEVTLAFNSSDSGIPQGGTTAAVSAMTASATNLWVLGLFSEQDQTTGTSTQMAGVWKLDLSGNVIGWSHLPTSVLKVVNNFANLPHAIGAIGANTIFTVTQNSGEILVNTFDVTNF